MNYVQVIAQQLSDLRVLQMLVLKGYRYQLVKMADDTLKLQVSIRGRKKDLTSIEIKYNVGMDWYEVKAWEMSTKNPATYVSEIEQVKDEPEVYADQLDTMICDILKIEAVAI